MKRIYTEFNKAPKGEDSLVQREFDRREEKESAPITVEWGVQGRYDSLLLRGRSGGNTEG